MSRYPDLPQVEANGDGGPRARTQVVVIHATDNTASAEGEATYAETRPDQTSAHFYSDEGTIVQALDTDNVAYGCLFHGNAISVQFELVGLSNHLSDATMRLIAPIVARVCAQYGLPVVKISADQVAAGVKGICGHADITAAFPQDNGTHTDPGAQFPWSTFIGYVQASTNGAGEDDDMPFAVGPLDLPSGANSYKSYAIPPVNSGGLPWGSAWLSIWGDLWDAKAAVRVAVSDVDGNWTIVHGADGGEKNVLESGKVWNYALPTGARGVSIQRLPVDAADDCSKSLSAIIEYGHR